MTRTMALFAALLPLLALADVPIPAPPKIPTTAYLLMDSASGRVSYAGIGNTAMRRFGKAETRLVSQAGVLGQNMRTPRPQTLQLEPGDLIVLYTDGVSDRFTADDYPGVLRHAPKQVASNIVQRFGKDHDDAACIAVRYSA